LGDLIAAMDGLAAAPASHLVARLGADAPLPHIVDVHNGNHVKQLNYCS
jgi:hypothetical protein